MFLSEYTEYDFNDALSCSKPENIFELQTSHDEYAAFGFVEQTTLFQNFTNRWDHQEGRDRDFAISEWKLCEDPKVGAQHAIQMAAFYMLNYNCFYYKNPVTPDKKLTEIECNFQKEWWRNNKTYVSDVPIDQVTTPDRTDVIPLYDIFKGEDFDHKGDQFDYSCFK